MHHRLTPLALLCAAAASVHAQSESVDIAFSYDPITNFVQVVDAPQFDTQNGARQLESIGLRVAHDFSVSLELENTSDTNLLATDYVYEHVYSSNLLFGDFGDPGDPGDPFPGDEEEGPFRGGRGGGPSSDFLFDTGFFTIFDAEQALMPYDGVAGVDGVDQVTQQFDTSFVNQQTIAAASNPAFAAFMTGDGTVGMQVGGLIENFFQLNFVPDWGPGGGIFGQPLYPTDEALWFRLQDYSHSGTVTLTYNFVPAPGALGALGLAGLALATRRRR